MAHGRHDTLTAVREHQPAGPPRARDRELDGTAELRQFLVAAGQRLEAAGDEHAQAGHQGYVALAENTTPFGNLTPLVEVARVLIPRPSWGQ